MPNDRTRSGVTLHCFLRKKQKETEKKEATLKKKKRTEREKRSWIKEKTGTARKKRSHLKGKSQAGSKEQIFEKKERRILFSPGNWLQSII